MKVLIVSFLATFGAMIASFASEACFLIYIDEEECPRSLVK